MVEFSSVCSVVEIRMGYSCMKLGTEINECCAKCWWSGNVINELSLPLLDTLLLPLLDTLSLPLLDTLSLPLLDTLSLSLLDPLSLPLLDTSLPLIA